VLAALEMCPEGETKNTLREMAAMSGARFSRLISQLIDEGLVEPCPIVKQNRQTYPGYRTTWAHPPQSDTVRQKSCPSD